MTIASLSHAEISHRLETWLRDNWPKEGWAATRAWRAAKSSLGPVRRQSVIMAGVAIGKTWRNSETAVLDQPWTRVKDQMLERLQLWVGLAVLPTGKLSGVKLVPGKRAREFEFLIERDGISIVQRFEPRARFSEILSHLGDRGESIALERFIGLTVNTGECCNCELPAAGRARFLSYGTKRLDLGVVEMPCPGIIQGPSGIPGTVTCVFQCSRCCEQQQIISIDSMVCNLMGVDYVLFCGHRRSRRQ